MDPEVRELATAAVTALQTIAANSSPHWTDVAGVGVALVVGGTQCGLIAWGIRVMHDSNLTRESRQHEEAERQHEEAQRRHKEAQRQREEAERESRQRHAAAMAALTALIERTAPK
jgi:hypothetical protein